MKRIVLILPGLMCILAAASTAYCSTYYVDPNGSDTAGNGSIGNPWFTITKAAARTPPSARASAVGRRYNLSSRRKISLYFQSFDIESRLKQLQILFIRISRRCATNTRFFRFGI